MSDQENMYITGENALINYSSSQVEDFSNVTAMPRGRALTVASNRTFVAHDTDRSVRSDYNRGDYEYFRPSDTLPNKQIEIIGMCMTAYQKVGLVRNVIDLMGDFGSQGARLQHPVPSIQQFYTTWWEKIQGSERSERFLNQIYRCGQTIVKKSYGQVSSFQEKKWKQGIAKDQVKIERLKTNSKEIPLKYRFINPLNVEVLDEALAQFVGTPVLGLRISLKLRNAVRVAALAGEGKLTPQAKKLLSKIPKDVMAAIQRGAQYLPLDPDTVDVYYYKKDDWMLWANPMCYCVLDDLLMLNKLKLADISALDGAISNIRLWNLGIIGESPANSILPTKAAINKLRNILADNVGGGVLDLVWGPELKFTETNSQIWRWLGSEKYQITINNIYEGLGVPVSLRAGSGSTNTGNFVGLNTLVKRLQYGRELLVDFWTKELKYIHKAMGFAGKPPRIVFDFMALADEAAERQLIVNLWDREILSDETVLELFGRLPTVEKARVKQEKNERTNERMPYKASPFHNPDKEHDYRKILLQGGQVAPSEIGIDLNDRKVDEKSRLEIMEDTQLKMKEMDDKKQIELKKLGTPGRPGGVKETQKRKPKSSDSPSTKADFINLLLWANSAQSKISDLVTPALLHAMDKKNLRSLSKEEFEQVEKIKLGVLCGFGPFEEITEAKVGENLASNQKLDEQIFSIIEVLTDQFKTENGRNPKVDELRHIHSSAYSLLYSE